MKDDKRKGSIICETCGSCCIWYQTEESKKDCGYCEWLDNIETHKDDICKLNEE